MRSPHQHLRLLEQILNRGGKLMDSCSIMTVVILVLSPLQAQLLLDDLIHAQQERNTLSKVFTSTVEIVMGTGLQVNISVFRTTVRFPSNLIGYYFVGRLASSSAGGGGD